MADWQTKPLGDLCEFHRGLTYAKTDEVPVSKNIVLRANNVNLASNTLDLSDLRYIADTVQVPVDKKIRRGSLLICTASGSKSHLGKVAYVDGDYEYAFGGFMGQITPSAGVDGRYLFHALTSPEYKDFIAALSDGANINNLKFNDLRHFPVAAPNLEEQQRIVAILDEAFEGIATAKANAEKNLQNAREVFSSHLCRLFSQSDDLVALADIASDITDGDHMPPPKAKSGVPFITISNIVKRTRVIDFDGSFLVPPEYFARLKPNRKPRKGDVLYTVTGATLGIPVLVDDVTDFCFQRHIALIRPRAGVSSEWLSYAMASPQVFAQATSGATGAAQKTVSLSVLRGIKVPRHSESIQTVISIQLNQLFAATYELENLVQTKLAALEELKKSLLHQAFSGQL